MRSPTDRRPAQRSDDRREALLAALDRWLREESLEAVNIAEISKQAGVSRSAFYFYFENKGAAVAALVERMVDEVFDLNDVFISASGPPDQRVGTMLESLFGTWERHRHLFKAMLDARGSSASVRDIWDRARDSFVEPVAEMIRAERAAGTAPDGVAPEVLASVLLELNDRLLERLTLGGPLSHDELMAGGTAVWRNAIYGVYQSP